MDKHNNHIVGIFPGTFDPVTLGHIDIMVRASKFVDKLYVGVAETTHKHQTLFNAEERLKITKEAIEDKCTAKEKAKIEVVLFNELLIEFAESVGATVIVRGLRNTADFEYEFQMAGINSYMSRNIENLLLMAKDRHQFISSTFVKDIARLDGDVSHFVTDNVVAELKKKHK